MNRLFKPGALAAAMALTTTAADAEVLIRYQNIDANPDREDQWFVADSFSFGVEREMKESGEKGGTEDINIGVGELQQLVLTKSIDASTVDLAQLSLTGRTLGAVEVCITDSAAGDASGASAQPQCYLKYKLERCYVKSWSTSGDADDRPTEEVAFYYNKIAFQYASFPNRVIAWDNEFNRPWLDGEREIR